ncbi:MAG: Biotin-(acetyl-CoA carboxylase) ligase [Chloroflexi bacterium AL-W]|nr:Biotin-(acetyl-CoA carboxylase) ligase [Chloroflexi bacterium AL-N1]NOK69322.1 Biotin-(acetyl-CoA carboxylase) ligase [Chloroflexi bacterium AL-N10]NOK76383.1 Biotin-(acetyl-CoA carboxylase) ligase [Chloroflexi bacterium AL-N5]NOK83500.1 Biotin-(acetyl-CoA carboxylase) ligase [Chloroflexi bacterium AL-W]NOK91160.1 Biotin-(acetyl-CoA carboxylase) ligase [Chloroflexi bacterium AL-N15]
MTYAHSKRINHTTLHPTILPLNLATTVIGHTVYQYERVGSTNDVIKDYDLDDNAEGLVVVTEEQVAGRGRSGRGWIAPPKSNLLFSLLLRPTWLSPQQAFMLTMLAGVALCEAIEQTASLSAALKWPNDLMLPVATASGPALRKAAGILSEMDLSNDVIKRVIMGIGVNVSWSPTGVVDGRDLSHVATSVNAAAAQSVDRYALLGAFLTSFDTHYIALRQGAKDSLFQSWRNRLTTLGQTVTVKTSRRDIEGVAEEVDSDGSLLLRDTQGDLHTITAGDVNA